MYAGIPSSSAKSFAIMPPRLEACSPLFASTRSRTSSSVTAYVPPGIGFNKPPRPTTTSSVLISKLLSSRTFAITSLRKSFWATIESYCAITSVACLSVSSNNNVSSSNTPILVDVEPGLIISDL